MKFHLHNIKYLIFIIVRDENPHIHMLRELRMYQFLINMRAEIIGDKLIDL